MQFVGTKYAVINSGTAALHAALASLKLKGDEVIVPAISFVSSATSILHQGCTPIFVMWICRIIVCVLKV